jgi:colanic acid biosynthesis protein WcaH
MIPEPLYRDILRHIAVFCVDIVVRSPDGRYLLVKRGNEPLKGDWWVIGGRVLHGEKALNAARRKLKEEAGVTAADLRFLGYYEDVFDCNSFEAAPYHTVSLVFETTVAADVAVTLCSQSSDAAWHDTLPARLVIHATLAA